MHEQLSYASLSLLLFLLAFVATTKQLTKYSKFAAEYHASSGNVSRFCLRQKKAHFRLLHERLFDVVLLFSDACKAHLFELMQRKVRRLLESKFTQPSKTQQKRVCKQQSTRNASHLASWTVTLTAVLVTMPAAASRKLDSENTQTVKAATSNFDWRSKR